MSLTAVLECTFLFKGIEHKVVVTSPENTDGFLNFIYGFWLNDIGRLSTNTDGKYWIPPHRVLHIERRFVGGESKDEF